MRAAVLALLLIFASTSASAVCTRNRDPKKVILFIDTNSSYPEIMAADEAACERGESLVVIPYGIAESKEHFDHSAALIAKVAEYKQQLKHQDPKRDLDKFFKIKDQLIDARNEIVKYRSKIKRSNPDFILETLKNLAEKNVAVESIIASGHDGGGGIDGSSAEIDKSDIIDGFKKAFQKKPQLAEELQSVFLWGCYTATPAEIISWKTQLPQLRMIGGFHGMGPSNLRNEGAQLLRSALLQEKKIGLLADGRKINRSIASLTAARNTFSAFYDRSCNGHEYYFARKEKKGPDEKVLPGALETFGDFKKAMSCKEFENGYFDYYKPFSEIFSGEVAVPTDTDHGMLRGTYNFARENQQCFTVNPDQKEFNADSIGLLLFYEGVKKNFARTFSKLTEKSEAELKALDSKSLQKVSDKAEDALSKALREAQIRSTLSWLPGVRPAKNSPQDLKMRLKGLTHNVAHFEVALEKFRKSFWFPTPAILAGKSRHEIILNIRNAQALLDEPAIGHLPELKRRTENLRKLKHQMQRYLYELDPKCMDFLEWHESHPEHVARARC